MPASNYANQVDMAISLTASGSVTKERFIAPSGAQCSSIGERACGVAAYDAATTEDVAAYTGIVRVVAGGTVAIGADVMTDADGKAVTYAAGGSGTDYKVLGYAMTAGTTGNIMLVKTY